MASATNRRSQQRQSGSHSGVEAYGTIEKCQHPDIHHSTTGSTPRASGGLLFFIHNSLSFTRKPLSTTSKNDPHLEELTISMAMDNIEFLNTNMYILPANSCNGCYSPPLDHMMTDIDSLARGSLMLTIHSGTPDQPIQEATNWRIQSGFPSLQS